MGVFSKVTRFHRRLLGDEASGNCVNDQPSERQRCAPSEYLDSRSGAQPLVCEKAYMTMAVGASLQRAPSPLESRRAFDEVCGLGPMLLL